jgi:hypothetical protein
MQKLKKVTARTGWEAKTPLKIEPIAPAVTFST